MTRITTDRLVLTPPVETDFADLLALWGDTQVMRFIGKPAGRDEGWARLLKYAGHWSLFGFGFWVARAAGDGAFVGEFGVAYQRRADPALDDATPESGWALAADAQGKGYAGEALAAILDWTDTRIAPPSTRCLITPDNAASVRLATAQGYGQTGSATYLGAPVLTFARPLGSGGSGGSA